MRKKVCAFQNSIVFFIIPTMPRSAKDKGKAVDRETKEEAFSQLLMGGEEEFEGYLQENETLEEDDEEEPVSVLDRVDNVDDDEDDDNDSLNEWMQEDGEELIDDSEIT
jgi:hypothetical protein